MSEPDAPRPPAAEGDALERLENMVRACQAIHKPFADDVWVDDLRKVTEIARGVRMNTALRGVVPTLGAVAPPITTAERAALDDVLAKADHAARWSHGNYALRQWMPEMLTDLENLEIALGGLDEARRAQQGRAKLGRRSLLRPVGEGAAATPREGGAGEADHE